MPKENKDEQQIKDESTQDAVNQIREKFGEGAIMRFGDAKTMQIEVIPLAAYQWILL